MGNTCPEREETATGDYFSQVTSCFINDLDDSGRQGGGSIFREGSVIECLVHSQGGKIPGA